MIKLNLISGINIFFNAVSASHYKYAQAYTTSSSQACYVTCKESRNVAQVTVTS